MHMYNPVNFSTNLHKSIGIQTEKQHVPVPVRAKCFQRNNTKVDDLYMDSICTMMSLGLSSSDALQAIALLLLLLLFSALYYNNYGIDKNI